MGFIICFIVLLCTLLVMATTGGYYLWFKPQQNTPAVSTRVPSARACCLDPPPKPSEPRQHADGIRLRAKDRVLVPSAGVYTVDAHAHWHLHPHAQPKISGHTIRIQEGHSLAQSIWVFDTDHWVHLAQAAGLDADTLSDNLSDKFSNKLSDINKVSSMLLYRRKDGALAWRTPEQVIERGQRAAYGLSAQTSPWAIPLGTVCTKRALAQPFVAIRLLAFRTKTSQNTVGVAWLLVRRNGRGASLYPENSWPETIRVKNGQGRPLQPNESLAGQEVMLELTPSAESNANYWIEAWR